MKAQFKYSFLAGLFVRLPVFIVITVMILTFGILGGLGMLPVAALITAVSLGGVAIAVMMAVNIVGDIFLVNSMFQTPDAYLHALTPAPRRVKLFTSLVAMAVMDVVTMAVVITGEVWLSFNMADDKFWHSMWVYVQMSWGDALTILGSALLTVIGYMLIVLIILFCAAVSKSFLYKVKASWLYVILLGFACVYLVQLSQFILAPFGQVERYGMFYTINFTGAAALLPMILLTALEAAGMFALTAKLLERKVNL